MNAGLWRKSLREIWPATLACGLALLAFEALFAHVAWKFQTQMAAAILQMEFARNMLSALTGASVGSKMGPEALSAFAWVHPVALAILWAHAISLCTRIPAGEIDRGSVEFLLGLPVSRWRLYGCEAAAWALAGLVVLALGVLGNWIGNQTIPAQGRPDPARVAAIVANFYCLYLTVGGLTCLISASSDRRGKAVAAAFGIVLGLFLLNFLATIWEPARAAGFLSILHYYKPMQVLQDSGWPIFDMSVLAILAAALWIAGGVVFARRDIRTV
jgi:ABC-type transport system involved in multi-copper enzyme maturation permease subunit